MQKKAWHQQTKVKKVEYQGRKFDSGMERDFYIHLLSGKYRPNIQTIEFQPEFILVPKHLKNGKTVLPMKYRADFKLEYISSEGETITEIIDVKAFPTVEFKLKKKLFEYFYPYELIVITEFPKKYGGHFGLLSDLKKLQAQEKRNRNGAAKKDGKSTKAKAKGSTRRNMARRV